MTQRFRFKNNMVEAYDSVTFETIPIMQPYFSIDKGADAGLGNLDIDYVRTWSKRTV